MSSQIARQVITAFKESKDVKDDKQEFELSPREKEVITLLAGGNNYQQIADQLFISVDTVRHHIKNIYKKLHVHTQSEAVAKAIRRKII
jgi:DNA-binding CsgD family transcriptional regulator